MNQGAGILLITPQKHALFLKRGPGGDYPGMWCFPGGTRDGNETIEQCAMRECIEEIGFLPPGSRMKIASSVTPMGEPGVPIPGVGPVDPAALLPGQSIEYTTFLQRITEPFEPKVNGEHVGFAWAPVDQPPEPLHPGCRIAVERLSMNELDVARAIRDGKLTSPQHYENMWLFAMRITGTETAYRKKQDEFVYRRPENYLTDDFLARCNGLPVIVEHPKSAKLDSREFAERVVGTIFLPYIKGDEVWGVAKIYDDETAQMLVANQLSTSPSVVFRDLSVNTRMRLEDGTPFLIEGKPSLLDHLAICQIGVWDKGGDPSGVAVEAMGDSQMAEKMEEKKSDAEDKKEEKKMDKAKGDAHVDLMTEEGGGGGSSTLDKLLTGLHAKLDDCVKKMDSYGSMMDSMTKRMDSMEEERKKDSAEKEEDEKKADATAEQPTKGEEKKSDAEGGDKKEMAKEVVADKHKKDSEKEEEKEDAMADANDEIRKAIADLQKRLPMPMADADYRAMSDAQAEADKYYSAFSDHAPRPMDGETLPMYQRRLLKPLQKHSATWGKIDLHVMSDEAVAVAKPQIFADAMVASNNPDIVPPGTLLMRTRKMPSGHTENTFVGSPLSWMNQFASSRRFVTRINPKPN